MPEKENKVIKFRIFPKAAAIAACFVFLILVVLPNCSAVYARTLEKIPVIGGIVKVVTIRNYFYSDDYHEMNIEVPKIEDNESSAADFINKKYGAGTAEITITETYRNMYQQVKDHEKLISNVMTAMEHCSITPIITPIRGGTDGARLSYEGLPCPNLCTGGLNFHGRYEYICIQSMEKIAEILTDIVKRFATGEKQELL